jgi:hypothetical protein
LIYAITPLRQRHFHAARFRQPLFSALFSMLMPPCRHYAIASLIFSLADAERQMPIFTLMPFSPL